MINLFLKNILNFSQKSRQSTSHQISSLSSSATPFRWIWMKHFQMSERNYGVCLKGCYQITPCQLPMSQKSLNWLLHLLIWHWVLAISSNKNYGPKLGQPKLVLAYQYLKCNSNLINSTIEFELAAGSYTLGGWRSKI